MTALSLPIKIPLLLLVCASVYAGDGKLQETAGVTQIEGSGGGGLVPWATLSGYDSREQTSSTVFMSRVSLDDYRLQMFGASVGFYDRIEVSLARQTFQLRDIPFGEDEINQQIVGLKARIAGDLVYSSLPQISIGVQYKEVQDTFIASAAGADDPDRGTDFYVAATKAHLGAVFGYNLVWDLTLRATKANQFGLLGFGGDLNDDYELMAEGSLAVLFDRRFAFGVEYRQKPDNLSFAEEQDVYDVFFAYIPNKHFNLTTAWVDLGTIAGADNQNGFYLSLTGYLW